MNDTTTKSANALPPYDYTWARLGRRTFRLIVATIVLFTFALWFSEGYLRYDQSETQYRMALTLHPAQARPILRHVVQKETERRETPPSLYVEALARVEEPDKALPTYAHAYQINQRNPFLTMNYGCFLYFDGQYEEARERFREAGVGPPRNALPRYLEAAALAPGMGEGADLSDLLAPISRANASGDPVLFPDPLWHDSLPKRGKRYALLRRDMALHIVEPLAHCGDFIFEQARKHLDQGRQHEWEQWLEMVQIMGERLMGKREADTPPSLPQILIGLQLQYDAAQLRSRIAEIAGGSPPPELSDKVMRLGEALGAVTDFDAIHDRLIEESQDRAMVPLWMLLETGLLMILFYGMATLLRWCGSGGKRARAIPHAWIGKLAPATGLSLILGILVMLMIAQNTFTPTVWEAFVPLVWRVITGVLIAIGLAYPLTLARHGHFPGAPLKRKRSESGTTGEPPIPLRRYIGVYGCLLQRYMGVMTGGLFITTCLWLVSYRIAYSMYPFQLELVTTGLESETRQLFFEVCRHLAGQ